MQMTEIKSLKEMTGAEIKEAVEILRLQSVGKPYVVYKEEMQVFLDEINERGARLAKKYGKRYRNLTFAEMR